VLYILKIQTNIHNFKKIQGEIKRKDNAIPKTMIAFRFNQWLAYFNVWRLSGSRSCDPFFPFCGNFRQRKKEINKQTNNNQYQLVSLLQHNNNISSQVATTHDFLFNKPAFQLNSVQVFMNWPDSVLMQDLIDVGNTVQPEISCGFLNVGNTTYSTVCSKCRMHHEPTTKPYQCETRTMSAATAINKARDSLSAMRPDAHFMRLIFNNISITKFIKSLKGAYPSGLLEETTFLHEFLMFFHLNLVNIPAVAGNIVDLNRKEFVLLGNWKMTEFGSPLDILQIIQGTINPAPAAIYMQVGGEDKREDSADSPTPIPVIGNNEEAENGIQEQQEPENEETPEMEDPENEETPEMEDNNDNNDNNDNEWDTLEPPKSLGHPTIK